jgi:uracil-DNA glycosylase
VCYPPQNLIFNAFTKATFKDLKIVIVGQDPYIKENEAMGLSFSVPKTTKCPPSLLQIYNALQNDPDVDFKMPSPAHGDLTKWASQGVFLLNAILTVKRGESNSH